MPVLRQPIVVALGHVDHGKTSLLDAIRSTSVTKKEAGRITQNITASEVSRELLAERCAPVLAKTKLELKVPGLLFIDTPGHADFTNLRKRGGNIADLAILVIDVNKGIENQTAEAIEILKNYKTPFLVALNKIDAVSGWISKPGEPFSIANASQRADVQAALDTKLYELVGKLYEYGFSAERFDRVTDFTKQVLIIPCSAKTGEGLPELLLYLVGLAQRFLEKQLELKRSVSGRISILEVRDEKGLGRSIDGILYEGNVKQGDTIVFPVQSGVVESRVRALAKIKPAGETGNRLFNTNELEAASAVVLACDDAEQAVAGTTLYVARSPEELVLARDEAGREIREIVKESDALGVYLRADALGSLEAISKLFEREGVPVRSAEIGRVSKRDVLEALSVRETDRLLGVIFAFNVPVDDEARSEARDHGLQIFEEKIIYNLVQGYAAWKEGQLAAEKKAAFASLVTPALIRPIPGYVFRASNPAVFGVEVEIGTLKKECVLLNEAGEIVGHVKDIQHEKESVNQATRGQQVAISMPGVTFGRQVKEKMALYAAVPAEDAKTLLEKYPQTLTPEEKALLQKVRKLQGQAAF